MNTQNPILTDEELNHVTGGQVSAPVFRTVLDMSAASLASSIIKKRDELQMSIIRKM